MANIYNEKDIPQFQKEICKKECILSGRCIEKGYNNNYFLMCPHYHRWKIGYSSFVIEQIKWEQEHPKETQQRYEEIKEKSKMWNKKK